MEAEYETSSHRASHSQLGGVLHLSEHPLFKWEFTKGGAVHLNRVGMLLTGELSENTPQEE